MRAAYLHGLFGDPSVWDGIADAEGLRIALPGHLGGGPVRATWRENVDAIGAQVRGCDVAVGYSLGARAALGLVTAGHVARAILVSVNPGIADDERPARRANDAAWAHRLRTEPLATVLDAWEAQPLFATQARASQERRDARRARRLALDPEQLARSLEVMGLGEMPDYRASLVGEASLVARTALVVGADDAKFLAIARALAAPLHVVPDAGHDPLLEQPRLLAQLLREIRE